MGEITIQEALKNALKAQVAGEILEAEKYYNAILKVYPKHPDANNNMGVLSVQKGEVDTAISYFQNAISLNPSIDQFWINYLDALIKTHQLNKAREIIEASKAREASSDLFHKLKALFERSVKDTSFQEPLEQSINLSESSVSVNLKSAIRMASKKIKEGANDEAEKIYRQILSKFPKNKKATDGLRKLVEKKRSKAKITKEPSHGELTALTDFYSKGHLLKALEECEILCQRYPCSASLQNIRGNILNGLNRFEQAIEAFELAIDLEPNYYQAHNNVGISLRENGRLTDAVTAFSKAISIKKDYFQAYNNLGVALHALGRLKDALSAFLKAISMKKNYAEAFSNMGGVLHEQRKFGEAIAAYEKALEIDPDFAVAHNNLGGVLQDAGDLNSALSAYKKAIALNSNYVRAMENLLQLEIQLLNTSLNITIQPEHAISPSVNLENRPKFQIQNAIYGFLCADLRRVKEHLTKFENIDNREFNKLKQIDKIFCRAYSSLLKNLLVYPFTDQSTDTVNNYIFHLGESHALSYAHRLVSICGVKHAVIPKITFGAKAFHFSSEEHLAYKEITKVNFLSIPAKSKVFLSFGEIDCRPNEGFIRASKKLNEPIKNLICQTVKGYIAWFHEQNMHKKHHLYFLNVPAPVYNKNLTYDENLKVLEVIAEYNLNLNKIVKSYQYNVVDVNRLSKGKNGFSNLKFHVDDRHLGPDIIKKYEKYLP